MNEWLARQLPYSLLESQKKAHGWGEEAMGRPISVPYQEEHCNDGKLLWSSSWPASGGSEPPAGEGIPTVGGVWEEKNRKSS